LADETKAEEFGEKS